MLSIIYIVYNTARKHILRQIDMLCGNGSRKELRCGLRKAVRIFCGQILAGGAQRELVAVLGMASEIVGEAFRHKISLSDDIYHLVIYHVPFI